MKICVVGETRMPVLPGGAGGLGVATHEIATDLLKLGHDVTLIAQPGSEFAGKIGMSEGETFDVTLDYSHNHGLSKTGTTRVLNLIGDRECNYCPPCAVVQSEYMKMHYLTARLVSAGIDAMKIPFSETHGDYLLFMGANVSHKHPEIAQEVADKLGLEIKFIGPGFGEVDEAEKWKLLGGAKGLICPYSIDASPRAPLEAAACGTPTLCFDHDGTKDHVWDGHSGFVCKTVDEMIYWSDALDDLDRRQMRAWVLREHSSKRAAVSLAGLLAVVADGETW